MLIKRLGYSKACLLMDEAEAGDEASEKKLRMASDFFLGGPSERAKQLRDYKHKPTSEKHRQSVTRGHTIRHALEGRLKFLLCPLCGLIVHSRHSHIPSQRWHEPCRWAFRAHYQETLHRLPKADEWSKARRPKYGPNPETNLGRNYQWLIARRGKGMSRPELAKQPGSGVLTKPAVTEGIQAFLRLLPGSWDLVFFESHERRANVIRQELVRLPLEVEQIVGAGGRDPLIRHLLEFGMREADVARLTGMGFPRVKGIRLALKSPLVSSA
jgi:hypothetical protein